MTLIWKQEQYKRNEKNKKQKQKQKQKHEQHELSHILVYMYFVFSAPLISLVVMSWFPKPINKAETYTFTSSDLDLTGEYISSVNRTQLINISQQWTELVELLKQCRYRGTEINLEFTGQCQRSNSQGWEIHCHNWRSYYPDPKKKHPSLS